MRSSGNFELFGGCELEKKDHEIRVELHLKKLGLENFSMCVNPEDQGLSNQLLTQGIREPINCYFLAKQIKSTKTSVLDIGGNIGYFPIIEVLSGAREVTVYEPVTETFEFLTKNVAAFKNVKCYNIGIGETNGTKTIYITNRRNNASLEPREEYMNQNSIRITETQKVEIITLTDACNRISDNNVLCRMDVEGYESKILADIPEKVKGLSFEFHTKILGKNESINLIEKLENNGFKIALMTRELEGLSNLFKKFGFTVFRIYNLLKEKRIYEYPTKSEIVKVIKLMRENPHIFALR
jgi:FkbM family methyltransferase